LTKIISIATGSGPHTISMEELGDYVTGIYGDRSLASRKFGFLVRENSIAFKHSVVPDFIKGNKKNILFTKENPSPDTNSRMKVFYEKSVEISTETAEKAIQKSEIVKTAISHIITTSCTGLCAPGLEIQLIQTLGLNVDVIKYGINFMGCYAAFHALRLADTIIKSAPNSNVLIVCTELCSLHFRVDESDDNLLSTFLFSDGCAAMVVTGGRSEKTYLEVSDMYTTLIPDGQKDMAWHVGNNGFEMILSKNIPVHLKAHLNKVVNKVLEKHSLKKEDIQKYAIHPGGKNILKAFEEALNIKSEEISESYEVLKNYGNMSSATVLFVLEKILYGQVENPDYIFSAAFGPGLTVESALLRIKPGQ
jgi:alpha-pyrone synthase